MVKRQTYGSHQTLPHQASEDSLATVDSLNEMSTLVSQLNEMIVGADLVMAESEPVHFYQGADRVDEDIKCETVKADAGSMTENNEEETQRNRQQQHAGRHTNVSLIWLKRGHGFKVELKICCCPLTFKILDFAADYALRHSALQFVTT